jgi:hypothetical protein
MLDEYGVSLLGRGGRAMLSNTASTTNDDPHRPQGHHAPIPFLDVNGLGVMMVGTHILTQICRPPVMPNAVIAEIDCAAMIASQTSLKNISGGACPLF